MTRERYKQLQLAALENLKYDVEARQNDPHTTAQERDVLENQYQVILQKESEWDRGEFWTADKERDYQNNYKQVN